MHRINYIISIGRRCNTDDFLDRFKLRRFSSPFAYLLVDFATSIHLIDTAFANYFTKIIKHTTNSLMYNKIWRFTKTFFYNSHFTTLCDDYVYNFKSFLMWNHHDPISDSQTFKRRISRTLDILEKYPETTLLFYIDKIHIAENINDTVKIVIEKFNTLSISCKLCYIIPIENCSTTTLPNIVFSNNSINVISFPSNSLDNLYKQIVQNDKAPLLDCDVKDSCNDFNSLYSLLNCTYLFDLK